MRHKHLEILLKKMVSGSLKYSANEALAFILASDSDSNDSFGNESSLDSSDSHDSEEGPCFRGTEVDEIQGKDQQQQEVRFRNYYFCFFLVQVSPLMLALYSE